MTAVGNTTLYFVCEAVARHLLRVAASPEERNAIERLACFAGDERDQTIARELAARLEGPLAASLAKLLA